MLEYIYYTWLDPALDGYSVREGQGDMGNGGVEKTPFCAAREGSKIGGEQ